ncbi:MAG TPA: hypothetical protein VK911_10045 [Vicinamibacterales bacterium]|nr:hypothetical protein [Vicinamibacterales bacterium]
MLRGNCPAKIDDKGRLKIPQGFRSLIEGEYGRDVFVTSVNGDHVRIYPMKVWNELEAQLLGGGGPFRDPATARFFKLVNYFGQAAEIDNQGRVLIHPHLRQKADTVGEVDVLGSVDHLTVWNHERLAADVEEHPITEADEFALARKHATAQQHE